MSERREKKRDSNVFHFSKPVILVVNFYLTP